MILCAKNSFLLPHWLDDTSRNNIRYIKSDLMHMTTNYQKVFIDLHLALAWWVSWAYYKLFILRIKDFIKRLPFVKADVAKIEPNFEQWVNFHIPLWKLAQACSIVLWKSSKLLMSRLLGFKFYNIYHLYMINVAIYSFKTYLEISIQIKFS